MTKRINDAESLMESDPSQSLETTSLQARGLIAGNKGFVTIGEVARRVVVRAYATASERKSGTELLLPSPAVSSAGSYAADGAEGSTIGKCGVRAKGGSAADAFNGCGQGNTAADEKIR